MANSFSARSSLTVGGSAHEIFRLDALQSSYDVWRLPYTLRILLENVLRREDGETVTAADVEAGGDGSRQRSRARRSGSRPAAC